MAKISLDVGIGGGEAIKKLQAEMAELRAELDKLQGSTKNNKKAEEGLAAYRKEQMKEMKNYRFVVNEMRDAIGAGTIALNLMSLGSDGSNNSLKSLTNIVNTAFIAFQGLDAITSATKGPLDKLGSSMGLAGGQLGLIISLGGAAAGAILSIANESKKADVEIYNMNLKLAETNYQLGLISKQEYSKILYDNAAKLNKEYTAMPEKVTAWGDAVFQALGKINLAGAGQWSTGAPLSPIPEKNNIERVAAEQKAKDALKIAEDFTKKETERKNSSLSTLANATKSNELMLVDIEITGTQNKINAKHKIEEKYLKDNFDMKYAAIKNDLDAQKELENIYRTEAKGLDIKQKNDIKEAIKSEGDPKTNSFFWTMMFGDSVNSTLNSAKSTINAFNKDTAKMFGTNSTEANPFAASDYENEKKINELKLETKKVVCHCKSIIWNR